MIDWAKATSEDHKGVSEVLARCERDNPSFVQRVGFMNLMMDLSAGSIAYPMDWTRWIEADELNFWHDVYGIHQHINRTTGDMEDFFLPRFVDRERSME